MTNLIKETKIRDNNNSYNVIVEIPKGTNKKYELNDPIFDRVISVRKVKGRYPYYYGCFPQTFAGDKDPLDMILLTKQKYKSLDIVEVEILGVIKTIDNNEVDDKIVVKPLNEKIDIERWKPKLFKFLKSYKGKNANTIIDNTFYDKRVAECLIAKANIEYKSKNNLKIKNNLKFY